jgi:hypothetical protein
MGRERRRMDTKFERLKAEHQRVRLAVFAAVVGTVTALATSSILLLYNGRHGVPAALPIVLLVVSPVVLALFLWALRSTPAQHATIRQLRTYAAVTLAVTTGLTLAVTTGLTLGLRLAFPEGRRGVQGEQGVQGERGVQGEQGVQGERGVQGEQGVQGERGVQGKEGKLGGRGERGLQGRKGERGEPGSPGKPGDRGERGERGPRGEKGERGEVVTTGNG